MNKNNKYESTKEIIEALSKIGNAITSDLYLEDILKLIVTVTAEVMNSKICSIMLLDPKKNVLEMKATQSISKDYINKNPLKIGEGVAGKVVQLNKPIAVYSIMEDDNYKNKEVAKKENLHSMLCSPLRVRGKVIGVLNVYTSSPHHFTDSEISILSTVADAAAIVIENSRLMVESNLIREELETRKSIEKAKGIIMKDSGLEEQEAFKKIQKFAMDNRKSMREVSEAIILSHEMKKNML
jgi:two-component system, response regulator PdtaR